MNCLLVAIARLMGCNIQDICRWLGHDGTRIVWPNLPYPKNQRGIHMQELFPFLESKGYFCMKYEHKPSLVPHEGALGCPVQSNIIQYMVNKNGILLTDCHAYAWINDALIDVDGSIRQILNICPVIESFYWIGKIDLI